MESDNQEEKSDSISEEQANRGMEESRRIALAVIKKVNILPASEIKDLPPEKRWEKYYDIRGDDIVLCIDSSSPLCRFYLQTSLVWACSHIYFEMKRLFDEQKAREILSLDDSEIEKEIFDEAVNIIGAYVNHLPMILFHGNHQAYSESMISYIRNIVERRLEDESSKKGVKKRIKLVRGENLFSFVRLFPEADLRFLPFLQEIDDEFKSHRRLLLGDNKALMTNAEKDLPAQYESLRLRYVEAKRSHKSKKKSFYDLNSNAGKKQWPKKWESICSSDFGDLFFCDDMEGKEASTLAYAQLGHIYRKSAEYMKKLVVRARKRERAKKLSG